MQRRTPRKSDVKGPKMRDNKARLDRSVQNEIGRNLRAMYNDVVEQGVPDRFADLLAKLDSPANSKPPRKE
jgi:hypothetical protein